MMFKFEKAFSALTDNPPFPWQSRLFNEYLSRGELPQAIDIPTGLGKTAIMAIWLLARAQEELSGRAKKWLSDESVHPVLPRRLVYVVDRRTVVDQATEFADQIRQRLHSCSDLALVRRNLGLGGDRQLPVSTLRGRHIDNRQWMADPAATAIIVGTVDMIGSRLLFEGYGVSRKMRPFVAGLMGCDTLVVLDEAHLVPPFEGLLRDIEDGMEEFGARSEEQRRILPRFQLLPLSATGREQGDGGAKEIFRLCSEDYCDDVIRERLTARKCLTIDVQNEAGDFLAQLAESALRLGTEGGPARVLIYCNSRNDAARVKSSIEKDERFRKNNGVAELLVGARRVFEREYLSEWLRDHGLLGAVDSRPEQPVFLVATSAGEVGVDLDADHMVCDLVSWERMVQRLGRVNRRGKGDARVEVVAAPRRRAPSNPKAIKEWEARWKNELGRLIAPLEELRHLDIESWRDASPGSILDLKQRTRRDCTLREKIDQATTPEPLRPALTRPLLDAWAMTSFIEHSGRPELGPWLRGWVEGEEPQTTVLWRRYLPMRREETGIRPMASREIEAFFEAAPPQASELLETETGQVVDWLRRRAGKLLNRLAEENREIPGMLDDEEAAKNGPPLEPKTQVALILAGDGTVQFKSLEELARTGRAAEELGRDLAGRRMILDARVGGLRDGLLDPDCEDRTQTMEDNWGDPAKWGQIGDGSIEESGLPIIRVRQLTNPERDERNSNESRWRETLALACHVNSEEEALVWLVVEKWRGVHVDEESRAMASKSQRLDEHQAWVAERAAKIADSLGLPPEDKAMLVFAARYHDEGKKAPRWQRAFNALREDGPYAKTIGPFNRHALNGYRHEFQSVLDAEVELRNSRDHDSTRFDLALHLIAAHHGGARPAIGIEGCDSILPSVAEAKAREIALRFTRLQRHWGPWGLAWWEALLRAADQQASRMLDATDE